MLLKADLKALKLEKAQDAAIKDNFHQVQESIKKSEYQDQQLQVTVLVKTNEWNRE